MKTRIIKNCVYCQKEFSKNPNVSMRTWIEGTKFCSIRCSKIGNKSRLGISHSAWNKGLKLGPHSEEYKNKLSKIAKEKGFGKWMLGKETPLELRHKRSEYMKKRVADGVHNFYIDGRTPINQKIRHSIEYRLWREAVFARDNWTCQECKVRGVVLNADHIKPFAYYPQLRFAIDNGRTLCVLCHAKTDTYKGKALKYKNQCQL